jgi:hypothetical protein
MPLIFTGIKAMQRELELLEKRATVEAKKALRTEAEIIMTDSKKNFVPVDLGALRASGIVGKAMLKSGSLSVELSFGGTAAPQALAIHEHPSDHSPPTWRGVAVRFKPDGRGPKYLELPMRKASSGMAQRIANRIML